MFLLFLFILGMVAGSFLNVCIYRIPRRESIVFPASHCPECGHKLGVLDLVPFLSFLLLGGRCRYCGKSISRRYPVVELLSGLLLAGIGFVFPPQLVALDFIFYLIFIMLLLVISFIDLEHQLIPDSLVIAGLIFGLVFNFLSGRLIDSLIGLAVGFGLLFLVAKISKLVLKQEALGEGDVYLSAMIGAYLGWEGLLLALFLAYLFAAVAAVFLLLSGKVKMKSYVPFGPALAIGAATTVFFGRVIINWYLGIAGL